MGVRASAPAYGGRSWEGMNGKEEEVLPLGGTHGGCLANYVR